MVYMAMRILQIHSYITAAAQEDDICKDMQKAKIVLPTEEHGLSCNNWWIYSIRLSLLSPSGAVRDMSQFPQSIQ